MCGGPIEMVYEGRDIVVYRCKKCEKELYKRRKRADSNPQKHKQK